MLRLLCVHNFYNSTLEKMLSSVKLFTATRELFFVNYKLINLKPNQKVRQIQNNKFCESCVLKILAQFSTPKTQKIIV